MAAIKQDLDSAESVEILAEHPRYVVALITSDDAPGIGVFNVHISDDADIYERAYACGIVPRSADCVELISHDADWAVDGGPGYQLVYRHVVR